MGEVKRSMLAPGVFLTAVRTQKFKSACLSATFLTPLTEERASVNALVPYVLRRGTESYPDMESLSAALDELYGGTVEPVVRKRGEIQCVGFLCSFLDDAYTLHGEPILEPATRLLGELLLHPKKVDGCFDPDYTAGEQINLVDRIRGQINEKRQYSIQRLTQIMCEGEGYGVDRYGDESHASAITPQSLWSAYRDLLTHAAVELYYCGSAEPERVETALRTALDGLPVNGERVCCGREGKTVSPRREPKVVEESMEVTQGKLAMGFRTGGVTVWSEAYPALLVFNAVYGGTTTSKLFMNVREKLSLCYFASSALERFKGLILVSSGIEFDKYDKAREEILHQLELCRRGELEDWELTGGIRSVVSSLTATLDSQGRQEDYWLSQAVAGMAQEPSALAAQVEKVTREQVMAVAEKVTLDTVYFLKGQEDGHED